jgi:hypothetical protein
MHSRRAFLLLSATALMPRAALGGDAGIRQAAAELAELLRPRPKAFLHYHRNKFDIWVAATHLKLTIRDAGMPADWRRHYRVADAVAKDMAHATWQCYPGCRHQREHEFAERIIDSGEEWRWDTEIVS